MVLFRFHWHSVVHQKFIVKGLCILMITFFALQLRDDFELTDDSFRAHVMSKIRELVLHHHQQAPDNSDNFTSCRQEPLSFSMADRREEHRNGSSCTSGSHRNLARHDQLPVCVLPSSADPQQK